MPSNPFVTAYIKELDRLYLTGLTTEHSFRPALQKLLEQVCQCTVVNEQSHIDCGAPDLTLLRNNLPLAFVEAKNLEDGDLDGRRKNKEQFDRYKSSLDTVIFTDYLDFKLYRHGEWVMSVHLAEIQGKHICLCDEAAGAAGTGLPRQAGLLEMLAIVRQQTPQHITSAGRLAQLMAAKARLLRDIIATAICNDEQNGRTPYDSELLGYMHSFQEVLLHDITPKTFADIYAQTIAYGMFAARLSATADGYDNTPDTFTRDKAAKLIPKTNPFLRKVFQERAGYDLDERIAWIVDDLVAVFAATDIEKIMQGFGKNTQMTDPLMHFYEDFLFQYDPAAKKACGVYYTPQPVVNYIVRAVDDILRTDFGLPLGLADTSKVSVEQERQQAGRGRQDNRHRAERVQKHRVQVLDPAVGTGTFLDEVVRQIKRNLAAQMGGWQAYVSEHLLPRLYGFELMMAPYTIAHLKLDIEIGVAAQERLKVFLTNSLEEYNPNAGTLFGNALSQEANAASTIKKSAPIMVMLGNPPFSVSSNNKGEWISHLLEDYKKNLNERNIQPLSDDYIKFIRLGQYYVERNSEGVLAYISNNSFIDGLIHRQMRHELMRCFDKIYIIDLHGNARKKETAPDGSKDENVFDIMQGVSINIFVKTGNHDKQLAEVYHCDLYGLRKDKYAFFAEHNLNTTKWTKLNPIQPYYFFVPKDFGLEEQYKKGFKIDELMGVNTNGIKTHNDKALVSIDGFSTTTNKYFFYRPLDNRWIDYDLSKVIRHRYSVMRNMLHPNVSLILCRQIILPTYQHVFVSTYLSDINSVSLQTKESSFVFPLYLYPEEGSMETERPWPPGPPGRSGRRANLDEKIWAEINRRACLPGQACKETTPEEVFDYIYGVLHSPRYREQYREFLKVDFPRIPYPESAEQFGHFVSFGHRLRELHLLHALPAPADRPAMPGVATFPVSGTCTVEQPRYAAGRVYINATQYFDNVPETAWQFYIGGYQPAQKWLKDRKGRTLSFDDLSHYQKIICVLLETHRLMGEIDG